MTRLDMKVKDGKTGLPLLYANISAMQMCKEVAKLGQGMRSIEQRGEYVVMTTNLGDKYTYEYERRMGFLGEVKKNEPEVGTDRGL